MLFGKHVNKYYLKYFWHFFFGILALIIVDYAQILVPREIANIGEAISNGEITSLTSIAFIKPISIIFIVAVTMFIGRFAWRRCILGEAIRIQADIRKELFMKTEVLTQRYYKQNKTGAILAYFSNDLETIEEVFGFGVVQLIDGVFLSVLSFIKMFQLSTILTLIALIPLLILLSCAFIVDKYMEKKYEKRQKAFEDMSDFSQENFTGIRVIKAFVKEAKELRHFAKENKKNKDANIEFVKFGALLDVAINLLIYSVIIIIFCVGGYFVYQESIGVDVGFSTWDIIEFIGYFNSIIWPVFALASIINLTARGRTSLRRISSILDEEVEISDSGEVIIPSEIKGGIKFNNFSFAFPDDPEEKVLKNISFEIKPGETVGVIGKIGSGKSTLVNMLFRLYNVEKGTLFIDNYDIMDLPVKVVRNSIGYAPQDNFLFSDTIRKNIAFADDTIPDEEVVEAAEFSAVRSNIEEFSEGYQTMIGERGVTLSGGQKQRISISRAVVKDPKILVLDDSVSAVDIKTEETILNNIKKLRKGKTTILIASRVSTVEKLDKVLVLKDGQLEYFGTNKECLKNSPTYKRMVELQTLEKELEG
ncbi:MAG: ABC transporter ATP-binding protein [Erysipelotrichaceae bacterium]|nr:ABC transporter ATP-binding protein [Erysipelotrichaceae bacterium]